jgi:hypothetical protein
MPLLGKICGKKKWNHQLMGRAIFQSINHWGISMPHLGKICGSTWEYIYIVENPEHFK